MAASWPCSSCTFENSSLLPNCELCDSKRPQPTSPPSRPLPLPPSLPPSRSKAPSPLFSKPHSTGLSQSPHAVLPSPRLPAAPPRPNPRASPPAILASGYTKDLDSLDALYSLPSPPPRSPHSFPSKRSIPSPAPSPLLLLTVHFDGGARENGSKSPSPLAVAGAGYVLAASTTSTVLRSAGKFLGPTSPKTTNNTAEYAALISALSHVRSLLPLLPPFSLAVLGDSQCALNQVMGRWKCEKPHLVPLRDLAVKLKKEIEEGMKRGESVNVSFVH